MKTWIFISIILLALLSSCQNVDSLSLKIANRNQIECERIDFTSTKSGLYKKFEKLKKITSEFELLELIRHENIAVRGYASYALIDRDIILPSILFEQFMNEEERVSTFCGCLLGSDRLSSLIYYRYKSELTEWVEENGALKCTIDDTDELRKMDSLILYSMFEAEELLISAFRSRVYPDAYRERIEELAFEEMEYPALVYMYDNYKEESAPLLVKGLNGYLVSGNAHDAEVEDIYQMLNELEIN